MIYAKVLDHLAIYLITVVGNSIPRGNPHWRAGQAPIHKYLKWYIGGTIHPKAMGVKCLASGHGVATIGLEPTTNGS